MDFPKPIDGSPTSEEEMLFKKALRGAGQAGFELGSEDFFRKANEIIKDNLKDTSVDMIIVSENGIISLHTFVKDGEDTIN